MFQRFWTVGCILAAVLVVSESARADDVKPASSASSTSDYNIVNAGVVFRPQFCIHDCYQTNHWQNRALMTYGVEVGDRYFGLAIRYGQERRINASDGILRTVHEITPDLRVFYNWRVGPVLLSPFFEFSPMILFGGATGVHFICRPGFRATFLLAKYLDLSIEPFALDIDWYRFERYGSYSKVDLATSLRYSVSLGLHARW